MSVIGPKETVARGGAILGHAGGVPCIAETTEAIPSKSRRLPNLAPQIRVALSTWPRTPAQVAGED